MATFIGENTAVLDGTRHIFKGIIRGGDYPVITYFYDDESELDFINYDKWIYLKRKSTAVDILHVLKGVK